MSGHDKDTFPVIAFLEGVFPGEHVRGVQQLSGGVLNHVWRVQVGSGSVIVKRAPGHVNLVPEITLSAHRIQYEARALLLFANHKKFIDMCAQVRTPRLLHNDTEQFAIVMEDCGILPDLRDYLSNSDENPFELADALSEFIARLHVRSLHDQELAAHFDNHSIQAVRNAIQYHGVSDCLRKAGMQDEEHISNLADIAGDLGDRLTQPGRCLVMGDLWPRSLLISPGQAFLIDWEFVHFGQPVQDLAHLAAHLWMLADQPNAPGTTAMARSFLSRFLSSYMRNVKTELKEIAAHDDSDARVKALDAVERRGHLWNIQDIHDCAAHFACEILMRTVGPFQNKYLYDGLAPDDGIIQNAVQTAVSHLESPEDSEVFGRLLEYV